MWLTFDGAIKTTVVMTHPETVHLVGLLGKGAEQSVDTGRNDSSTS
ncbi:MAG: hypothetical protein ACT4NP_03710 [Pseudonocardiales bacterium]